MIRWLAARHRPEGRLSTVGRWAQGGPRSHVTLLGGRPYNWATDGVTGDTSDPEPVDLGRGR